MRGSRTTAAEVPIDAGVPATQIAEHVGFYLGNHAGKDLYISARDDGLDVFGLGEQFKHGIQIKYTRPGIHRRHQP